MTVRDTMGNPVQKLVEQVWLFVAGTYPVGNFRPDKIRRMIEFSGIIHVPDITSPERSAGDNTQKAGEVGVVVKSFLWNIRI